MEIRKKRKVFNEWVFFIKAKIRPNDDYECFNSQADTIYFTK